MSDMKKQENHGMKMEESGSEKSTGRPTKRKVIKSPVKNETAEVKSTEQVTPFYPCNDYLEEELLQKRIH